jgi:hypothetical protein
MKNRNFIFAVAFVAMYFLIPLLGGVRGGFLTGGAGVGYAQIGINENGAAPNSKATLDIDPNVNHNSGLLIPRLTTTQRNAIATPIPESLLIYNTTTQCFEAYNATTLTWVAFGCIGCTAPTAVTASAAPNPICAGSTLTLTGSATGATGWSWTGPNGYTSSLQSPTIASITIAGAGVYTLAAGNTCGWTTGANTASVTVSAAPTTAAAGSDINPACGVTTATLAGNTPTTGTGTWTVVSGTATITTPGSPTSGVTGLAVPGVATLRWTISNPPCTASTDDVVITTTSCCGGTLAINHTIGVVCPETKSVNYGTVSSTLGGTGAKCWITQNLGATNQATSATDATDAAAGWYWQFNRKQGYKVGPTPAWTITSISEASDWVAAQDPCTIELGTGWRIPTYTEWTNADATGAWNNYNDTYASVLKLHAAGYLGSSIGSLISRGTYGYYWSSTRDDATNGWTLYFYSSDSYMSYGSKAYGFSLRCLRD